jgi:hypothetical protein
MLCKPVAPCALRCARSALSLPARPAQRRSSPRLRAANGSSNDGSSSSSSSSGDTTVEQAAAGSAAALAAAPAPGAAGTSPFLDPLVRSLFLGVGAGIVCETVHVFLKVCVLADGGERQQQCMHASNARMKQQDSSSSSSACDGAHACMHAAHNHRMHTQ